MNGVNSISIRLKNNEAKTFSAITTPDWTKYEQILLRPLREYRKWNKNSENNIKVSLNGIKLIFIRLKKIKRRLFLLSSHLNEQRTKQRSNLPFYLGSLCSVFLSIFTMRKTETYDRFQVSQYPHQYISS